MRFLKDKLIHVGSQLGFQSLFYTVVKNNYSLDYISYDVNSLAFLIGWFISTICVYLTVHRLINRWFYKEPLTVSTFGPPLAFILILLGSYSFDGLTGEVSNALAWVNLIASLFLPSLLLFCEDSIKEKTEEKPFVEKKEEPLPKETPFKLTSFNNDVQFLWNRIHTLLQTLASSNVEERHVLENMQRELHRIEQHYVQIPHGKRAEANTTVADILLKMEENVSCIEEGIYREQLHELKKIQAKYHV